MKADDRWSNTNIAFLSNESTFYTSSIFHLLRKSWIFCIILHTSRSYQIIPWVKQNCAILSNRCSLLPYIMGDSMAATELQKLHEPGDISIG